MHDLYWMNREKWVSPFPFPLGLENFLENEGLSDGVGHCRSVQRNCVLCFFVTTEILKAFLQIAPQFKTIPGRDEVDSDWCGFQKPFFTIRSCFKLQTFSDKAANF